jgi:hypothetical protein
MLPTVQPLRPPIQSNVTPTNQFQSPLQHHGISAAALQRSELNYSSLMSPPNQNFVVPGVRFFQPHISTVNDISSASTAQHHTTQTHVPIHRSNSPQDVMLRLEASLSELADSEAEVRHRIQRAEEILRREFEAPIQLTNPCEYIDRCEDYQMIALGVDVLLGLVGIELLGLVPELSESGRELRVHVSNTATCS